MYAELKKGRKKIIITGIFSFILILVIAGYTYSYFVVRDTDTSTITGTVVSGKLEIEVNQLAPTEQYKSQGLVPQLDRGIASVVVGRNNLNCVDDNYSSGCQVYEVVVTNKSNMSTRLDGFIRLNAKDNSNFKWALIDSYTVSMQTNPTLTTDANSYQVITMVENQEIRAVGTDTATKTYYLVVWISETGREQNDTGIFTGSITFEPTIYTSYVLEKQTDSGNFLSTSIPRNQIDSLSFINTADAPANSIDVLDVSLIDDNSVQLYYTDNGNNDAYEVMIGTENGTVVASSGYKLFSRLGLPEKLTIDLTNLDTSRVIDMSYMFEDFKAASLSFLSSFDTSNVIDMNYMFGLCGQLETISLSDKFKTTKVVDSGDMFMWCYDLRGGTGTTYDENHTNATYARIDIESTPGYFTLKST